MEIVSLIFSGMSLAAALTVLVLLVLDKKAARQRRTDLMNYFAVELQSTFAALQDISEEHYTEVVERLDKIFAEIKEVGAEVQNLNLKNLQYFEKQSKRLKDLEDGVIPDYNAAMAAKNQVDEFSAGVMAILTHGNPIKKPEETEEVGDG